MRVPAWALAVVALATAAGPLLALAASSFRGQPARPRTSVCVGTWFRVERSARPLGIQPLRVQIFDPAGRLVWQRRRRVGAPQKRWSFRAQRLGLHRIVYRRGSQSVPLEVLATRCSRELRLQLNDRGRALFALRNLGPGDTGQACVTVTYTGNRPVRLRMYGTAGRTGLDRHLQLTVVRGWTSQRTSRSCRAFRPDRRSYLGLGRGIVYTGTLEAFPDSFAEAPDDATWHATRIWRRGTSRAFRLVVTLPREVGNEAQGLTATQAFVWEARPTQRRPRAPGAHRAGTRP
ncbi:MAG: hypothetical protein ABR583_08750 [Gaiellaceae bacterium]